jgi:polar amino acid transport system substrate-binding protein
MLILGKIIVFLAAAFACCGPAFAQAPQPASATISVDKELIVGTKEAPPFAIKLSDGNWTGISIELWRRIADENKIRYRLVEVATVPELIDSVTAAKFDVAVAALTVTAARENALDFTSSFYATGLGIAVAIGGPASWAPVLRALTSFGFLQAVLALIGLALAVGLIVWLFERRHNEDFGGGVAKGLGSSVWWTTVAMTQRGIGNFGPRTLPGRTIAILWMVGSIIAIAVFTAGITSALTVRHLQGSVQNVTDLSSARVGAISGSSTEDTLVRMRIRFDRFLNARDGLLALRRGEVDAFVYDKPLLAWFVSQEFRGSIVLLDTTFDPQHYAFALPPNSPLRKPLSVAMLQAMQNSWWEETLFRYLGYR